MILEGMAGGARLRGRGGVDPRAANLRLLSLPAPTVLHYAQRHHCAVGLYQSCCFLVSLVSY